MKEKFVEINKYYSGKISPESLKFTYDKSSKKRPAWIWVKELPKDVMFISTRINKKIEHYRVYLSTEVPLFLPTTYTREEMKKYYDKFAEIYDENVESKNLLATRFLLNNISLPSNAKILDLGAGSGISSLPFIEDGYSDITLLDYSEKMLEKAMSKEKLKDCKFICKDIMDLRLKNKFDLIFSVFSFASKSYFKEEEMADLWEKVNSHLKTKGLFVVMGYDFEPPNNLIKKIKSGEYEIIPGYKAKWYIGIKK